MSDYAAFARLERDGWWDADTARSYAEGFAAASAQCVPEMIRASGARPGSKALDLCCGHGIVAEGLLAAGARVTALDFSAAMLAMTAVRVPSVTLVRGDAMRLPFADDGFDVVTIGFGIPHVPDAAVTLAEANRVLRPGGRIVLSAWRDVGSAGAFGCVYGAVRDHGDPSVALPPGPDAHTFADPERAFPALREAGFRTPEIAVVESAWQVEDPAAPFDYFIDGTVRGAALLRPQSAERRAAIREAVAATVRREFGSTAPWRVPVPAAIVSALA
ncbi:methyltransferase domain-containing protein [Acuticoccus mangrovi]|uniref:Methyltransferase domain-containing protein n=1 Tax=Acuticoccus mangrovi TaxID=2796142 RepID=A0A934MMP3_9HYPH|nr:methyltransferase domain-containing protein [Acuticoccus mangrovi]MBJ3777449.1 methyltransferase domain-containing protein [Acuticoccus mangrovi]